MRAASRPRTGFGQSEVFHLAFNDQLLNCACNIFYRHVRIHAMLIKQIDHIASQTPQRFVGDLTDALRAAICTLPRISLFETKLGRDNNRFPKRLDCFTNQFFIGKRAVRLSRIEEGYSELKRRPDQCNRLLFISGRPVTETESHAPEANFGDSQSTLS